MYITIGRKLKGLGNVRICHRLKGSSAFVYLCIYWILNFYWFLLLGTLWLMYGMGYVLFYLPIKGIVKLVKGIKKQKQIDEAAKKYERPNNENSHQE